METSQWGFKTTLSSLPSVRTTRAEASVGRDEKDHSQLDNLGMVPAVNGFLGPGQFLPHPVHGSEWKSTLVHIPCRRLCFLFQFRSLWSFHVLLMPVWVFFLFFLSCWFSDCRLAGDSSECGRMCIAPFNSSQ